MLGIDERYVTDLKKQITTYFTTGKFLGKDVFNEMYSEFVDKTTVAWINDGTLPN